MIIARRAFAPPAFFFSCSQDYPKSLGSEAKVGFTSVDPWLCFSPCKNNTSDAAKAQVHHRGLEPDQPLSPIANYDASCQWIDDGPEGLGSTLPFCGSEKSRCWDPPSLLKQGSMMPPKVSLLGSAVSARTVQHDAAKRSGTLTAVHEDKLSLCASAARFLRERCIAGAAAFHSR